jgi:hypothetical protein
VAPPAGKGFIGWGLVLFILALVLVLPAVVIGGVLLFARSEQDVSAEAKVGDCVEISGEAEASEDKPPKAIKVDCADEGALKVYDRLESAQENIRGCRDVPRGTRQVTFSDELALCVGPPS